MSKAGEPRVWAVLPEPRMHSYLAEGGTKMDLSKRSQRHGGGATSVGDTT